MKEILNKTTLTILSVFILLLFLLSLSGCAGQAFRILNNQMSCSTEETLSSDCDGNNHVRTYKNTKCEILTETVSSCYRCLMTSDGPNCLETEAEWNAYVARSTATFDCAENYGENFVCIARDQLDAFETDNCGPDDVLVAHCKHNCVIPVSDSAPPPDGAAGSAVLDTTSSDDSTPTGYAVSRKGVLASKGLISTEKAVVLSPTRLISRVEFTRGGNCSLLDFGSQKVMPPNLSQTGVRLGLSLLAFAGGDNCQSKFQYFYTDGLRVYRVYSHEGVPRQKELNGTGDPFERKAYNHLLNLVRHSGEPRCNLLASDYNCCFKPISSDNRFVGEFYWLPNTDGTSCNWSRQYALDGVCNNGFCVSGETETERVPPEEEVASACSARSSCVGDVLVTSSTIKGTPSTRRTCVYGCVECLVGAKCRDAAVDADVVVESAPPEEADAEEVTESRETLPKLMTGQGSVCCAACVAISSLAPNTCVDSDGDSKVNEQFKIKGSITYVSKDGSLQVKEDFCQEGTLFEMRCDLIGGHRNKRCTEFGENYACVDGACVSS
jgi:hypothetical protein